MSSAATPPNHQPQPPRLLYCRCAYAQVVPENVKNDVLAGLAEAGEAFEAVPDLCEMAARRDPQLAELAAAEGPLRIAACWPRAVRGLFMQAGAALPTEGVSIHNMRTDDADAVLAGMRTGESNGGDTPAPSGDTT